ncbi:MAG: ATP-binding cassette domain-containing protein, partial [Chloroflexota bacterium]|nr:ATP-binding cassette domain-containing protein [Chloroflexota bacterium]
VEYRRWFGAEPFRAVDDVSLEIAPGETMGLVGESGSGKTTLSRAVLGLVPLSSGAVRFDGADITRRSARLSRSLSREIQVVFQDPYSSLNPTRTIRTSLVEPLSVHPDFRRRDAAARAAEMIERVGLPADALERYPGDFSGGQRQRIAIARALMISPRLLICDEPLSALDLSVQAQILNLLMDLQRDLGLSYLFISHDLAVVRHIAHRVTVLYGGRVMETGTSEQVCERPTHEYTQRLVASGDGEALRRRLQADAVVRDRGA